MIPEGMTLRNLRLWEILTQNRTIHELILVHVGSCHDLFKDWTTSLRIGNYHELSLHNP